MLLFEVSDIEKRLMTRGREERSTSVQRGRYLYMPTFFDGVEIVCM
jgi:hypothetical protein